MSQIPAADVATHDLIGKTVSFQTDHRPAREITGTLVDFVADDMGWTTLILQDADGLYTSHQLHRDQPLSYSA
jgi:hypothetical protein